MTETVTAGERKFPLCSYPKYPKFEAAAFVCAE
jgi:hypothetical protein